MDKDASDDNDPNSVQINIPEEPTKTDAPSDVPEKVDEVSTIGVSVEPDTQTEIKEDAQKSENSSTFVINQTQQLVRFAPLVVAEDGASSPIEKRNLSLNRNPPQPPVARNWKRGLFGCCDGKHKLSTVVTFLFPVYTEYKIGRLTSNYPTSKTIVWMFVASLVSIAAIFALILSPLKENLGYQVKYLCLSIFIFAVFFTTMHRMLTIVRFRIRLRYFFNIDGSLLKDIIQVFFCRQCVLCQMHAELQVQRNVRGSVGKFKISVKKRDIQAPKSDKTFRDRTRTM